MKGFNVLILSKINFLKIIEKKEDFLDVLNENLLNKATNCVAIAIIIKVGFGKMFMKAHLSKNLIFSSLKCSFPPHSTL